MSRTVLSTGASRGIGRAVAEHCLAEGHRLCLGLRDPAAVKGTLLDNAHVLPVAYDASQPEQATSLVDAATSWAGGVDALIHCAGILHRTPLLFEDGQEAELEELWRVNVMGPWWLTRSAWPHLRSCGHGRIQVLVSMSGKRVKGRMAGYPVSKFGLMALCQSMRNEGFDHGIRVTAICPSWVNTAMALSVSSVPAESMTQPRDLACLMGRLLELPDAAVPFEIAVNCALET